ncbi:MAG TPA: tol-pal system protein YbgF [Myxococcota bacterium]|nr:tol-pal system protein YbgF [Myxococcota bacterium]HOD08506.1 tol-pal system protein YbgF [Myxococcota bacterium]HPB49763.1 tol-pal system protein YbgF [Myxococcota bacterium]HQP94763.1 tol-pal system protein YbgF [Myxococcota bacterium]
MKTLVQIVCAGVLLTVLPGCAGGMKQISLRFDELEKKYLSVTRTNASMRNRVDDLENKVLLLQDEVETQRLIGMRAGPGPRATDPGDGLPVLRLSPGGSTPQPVTPSPALTKSVDISPLEYVAGSDTSEPDYADYGDTGSYGDSGDYRDSGSSAPVDGGSLDLSDSYSSIDDMGRVVKSRSDKSSRKQKDTAVKDRGDSDEDRAAKKTARATKADKKQQAARALDEYKAAYAVYNEGRIDEARAAFIAFVDKYPGHAYADNARYWVGECYYDVRDFENARTEFMRVITDYPDGNKVPDAMVKVGLCDQNLGRFDDARNMYDSVILTYPDSDAAGVAVKFMSRLQ